MADEINELILEPENFAGSEGVAADRPRDSPIRHQRHIEGKDSGGSRDARRFSEERHEVWSRP